MKLFEKQQKNMRVKKDWVYIHLTSPWYVNGKLDRVKYFELMSSDIKEENDSYIEII